jgi:hypothetical protein
MKSNSQMLYLLSYPGIKTFNKRLVLLLDGRLYHWWGGRDLNTRHHGFQFSSAVRSFSKPFSGFFFA